MTREQSRSCSGKKPVQAKTILSYDFKPKPPIMLRGILPAGGGLILAGESGVGKSLMRLEWSLLLAAGLQIYDIGTPRSQTVIVFQAENTITTEQFRLDRIRRGLGMEQIPETLYYAPYIWPSFITEERYHSFARDCIETVGATVAMFDPLISYHNAPENDNVRMRSVLEAFTALSRETGAAIILIHHFGKPSEVYQSNDYRIRGAQAIKDWADTAITITPIKSLEGDQVAYRKLEFIKIRSGPYHPPMMLRRGENFIHTMAEDMEQSPLLALLTIVKHRGMNIHNLQALIEKLNEVCGCGKKIAQEVTQQAIRDGALIETVIDGIRGFRLPQG